MKLGSSIALVLLAVYLSEPSNSSSPTAFQAVQHGIQTNLDYAQDWTQRGDHKSLGSSAAALELLADVLARQSEEKSWQTQVSGFRKSAQQLNQVAKKVDFTAAKEILQELARQNRGWEPPPNWQPQSPDKPSANLGQMMHLLDGTYADAKLAATLGEAEATRKHARILAELAISLQAYRDREAWRGWSNDLQSIAAEIAGSEDNAAGLRKQLRRIDQSCRNCHNRQR